MGNQYLDIALALVSLLTAASLLMNWVGNKQIPGLLKIAAGFLVACVGILLFAQQGELPVIITVLLANILMMAGRIPILFGLASFWNQETSKIPLLYLVLSFGAAVGFYYFTFIGDSQIWRVRIFTIMQILFSLGVIYILVQGIKIERKLHPVTTIITNFGAYTLLALSAFNTITQSILLILLDGQSAASPEEATSILILGAIVNIVIFTISILTMTMEELKVEHQEDGIFDPITTILNERTFIEVSNRVLGIALRYTKPVSMLTIELTNFDDIVKQHGTKVGNAML
mgnify:CR=1 FL=1